MVLRYDVVVSDEFSYYLCVLVEDTQQGRSEYDSFLPMCFCVSHGESQPRERVLPAPVGTLSLNMPGSSSAAARQMSDICFLAPSIGLVFENLPSFSSMCPRHSSQSASTCGNSMLSMNSAVSRLSPLDNCRGRSRASRLYLKFIFFSLPRASLRIALSYAFNNFSSCSAASLNCDFSSASEKQYLLKFFLSPRHSRCRLLSICVQSHFCGRHSPRQTARDARRPHRRELAHLVVNAVGHLKIYLTAANVGSLRRAGACCRAVCSRRTFLSPCLNRESSRKNFRLCLTRYIGAPLRHISRCSRWRAFSVCSSYSGGSDFQRAAGEL